MFGLSEKCESLFVEEEMILDLKEDFMKKKKALLQEVKEQIKAEGDEALLQAEVKLVKVKKN